MKRPRSLVAAPLVLVLIVLLSGQGFKTPTTPDNTALAAQEATPEARISGALAVEPLSRTARFPVTRRFSWSRWPMD